ncbi:hypothetical protein F5Y08DRAFT_353466 [Xylaria arbuscula]|nr:hypothetical protein F5Y08DRAFT_353466 [Xylaria arbuscula]
MPFFATPARQSKAYIYRSCRRGSHCKFVDADICTAARLGLREKCRQARIINGGPRPPRDFPRIDGICGVCYPVEAQAEEEEKKRVEEEEERVRKKAEKEADAKQRDLERQEVEERTREDVAFAITNNCSSVYHLGL